MTVVNASVSYCYSILLTVLCCHSLPALPVSHSHPTPLIHSLTRKKITQKHNIWSEKSLSPCCYISQFTIVPRAAKYTVHVELVLTNAGYFMVVISVLWANDDNIRTVSSGSLQTYTHLSKPCLGIFQCWCCTPCLSQKINSFIIFLFM